jgi:hypothetical protein
MQTSITEFYNNNPATLFSGEFTLTDILAQTDTWLEKQHDFIQLLFPLPEVSIHNKEAPTLTPETIEQIFNSPLYQSKIMLALIRMLKFFKLNINNGKVERSVDFNTRYHCYSHGHNHLRLTRIIRCLYLCGLTYWSESLYNILIEIQKEHNIFSGVTLNHFKAAASGELYDQPNTIIGKSV